MKTKEELSALKVEVDTLNKKLAELNGYKLHGHIGAERCEVFLYSTGTECKRTDKEQL